MQYVKDGKSIPASEITKMLRKIVFSGDGKKQYLVSGFPETIQQAKDFEDNCTQISAVIYATPPS